MIIALPTKDDSLEHIWFDPIKIEGDKIVAICANDPRNIAGLKCGDKKVLSRKDLSDWMITIGDDCYGGYTLRVAIKEDPRIAQQISFNFLEPEDYK